MLNLNGVYWFCRSCQLDVNNTWIMSEYLLWFKLFHSFKKLPVKSNSWLTQHSKLK